MLEKTLHIVSFAVPYPANYGGVIEVFHKIKALKACGVKVVLHCFLYEGHQQQTILLAYCDQVYYYDRITSPLKLCSLQPYIVESRRNENLLTNLLKDDAPILFEGVHCTAYLNHPLLKKRKMFVRMANIESNYYQGLFKASRHFFKKCYYLLEALKLKRYETRLNTANNLLAISKLEYGILGIHYGEQVVYIPSFHPYEVKELPSTKAYLLYHGNLKVEENEKAAIYLVEHIFSKLTYAAIIAGKSPSDRLKKIVQQYDHIELIDSPTDEQMEDLIQSAKVNVLYTDQSTGLKLKLLNVLFNGHAVVVNPEMIEGTLLKEVVVLCKEEDEMLFQIDKVMKDQLEIDYQKRYDFLADAYSNEANAKQLVDLIFS